MEFFESLVTKQTIVLFLILSLLSSVISTALTSEQINQSFGAEAKDKKPKETKSKSKSDSKPKDKDKPKEDTKSKEEDKSKEKVKSKENDDNKQDDISTTSTDNKPTSLSTECSTTPPDDPSDLATTTDDSATPTTNETSPSSAKSPKLAIISQNNDLPCNPSNASCSSIYKLSYERCPSNYNMGNDGFCHRVSCTLPEEQCPPPICDLFTEICYWNEKCKTNSTEQSCDKPSKVSSSTDSVIKFYITNPIIQQQVAQHLCIAIRRRNVLG